MSLKSTTANWRRSSGRPARASRRCCTSSEPSTGRPAGSFESPVSTHRTMSDRQLSGVRSHLIGFVFQSFFLLEGMTAVDNVANGLLYRGKSLTERRDAAVEALQRVGLGQRLDPHTKPDVWRRASACGDRERHRQPAIDRARRRTDRQPRFAIGRCSDGAPPRAARRRPDDPDHHARS